MTLTPHPCPTCSRPLWLELDGDKCRLWCRNVYCWSDVCRNGVEGKDEDCALEGLVRAREHEVEQFDTIP